MTLIFFFFVVVFLFFSSTEGRSPPPPSSSSSTHIHVPSTPFDLKPGAYNYFTFPRPEGTREFYLYLPTFFPPSPPLVEANSSSSSSSSPSSSSSSTARTDAWGVLAYYHGWRVDWTEGVNNGVTGAVESLGPAGRLVIAFGRGTNSSWDGPQKLGWNAGVCCLFINDTIVDDVAFTRQMLTMIGTMIQVNSSRVYAMGMSNGAFMTEKLMCEASDLFAGGAAVAGAVVVNPGADAGLAACDASFAKRQRSQPLRLYLQHGTHDALVPWTGSVGQPANITQLVPSVLANVARWSQRLGCSSRIVSTYNDGTFSNLAWPQCESGSALEFMSFRDGGHAFNGDNFQAAAYALRFFTSLP